MEGRTLTRPQQVVLVREAARAPSVHNVQPARWRFDSGDLVLFRALDRVLPVADPTGHDIAVSLGAAFEGMSIALSRLGLQLDALRPDEATVAEGCAPVLRASIADGAQPDRLAPWVHQRKSHRGRFARRREADLALMRSLERDDIRVVDTFDAISQVAREHDRATWHFESREEYHRELWHWLRLSPRDSRYTRDGLTAPCLGLSSTEARLASMLLRPDRFALLARLGVARLLVSEQRPVRSALVLVLFTPRRSDAPFDVGRRFYRLWLELTALGLHAAPMSATADLSETREELERRYAVPSDRGIANVLRVGRVGGSVPESPRLPVEELLV